MHGDAKLSLPPRDVSELRSIIVSRRLGVPEGIRVVLEIGFSKPELIAFGSAKSIAQLCGIAPSTVWRVTTFLGFAHFRDFKRLYQSELRARRTSSLVICCHPEPSETGRPHSDMVY